MNTKMMNFSLLSTILLVTYAPGKVDKHAPKFIARVKGFKEIEVLLNKIKMKKPDLGNLIR